MSSATAGPRASTKAPQGVRGRLGRALAAGWAAAALLGGLDLVTHPALAETSGASAAAWLGLAAPLVVGYAVGAWADGRTAKPHLQTVLAGIVGVLVARPLLPPLFDGGTIGRLPGARFGPIVAPWLFALAVAAVRWTAARIAGRRPNAVHAAAVIGGVALDVASRSLRPDEHPAPHLLLALAAFVAVAAGIDGLLARRSARLRPAFAAATVVTVVGLSATVRLAALGPHDRQRVLALRHLGYDADLWLRGARRLVDRDGDGASAGFGGGDCDDTDPLVHPGAYDAPDDDVDQDCDGRPASPVASPARDASWAAFWRSEAARDLLSSTKGRNVLVLSVDTLRLDAATGGLEGIPAPEHLAALFARSAFFERAFAPSAGTDLSVASFWTGRYDAFERPVEATLGERLVAAGYRTAAVLPRETLRYVGKTLLSRGIEDLVPLVNDARIRDVGDRSTTARSVELGLAALDRLVAASAEDGRPWMLWIHFFDVHEHHEIRADDPALVAAAGGEPPDGRRARYAAALRLVDDGIGRVLAGLEARGLADDTLVVFFSDHGEGLGEDPRLPENHGLVLYAPLVRVPLAVAIPDRPGRRVTIPVTLADLYEGLLVATGAAPPPADGPAGVAALLADPPPPLAARFLARPLPLYEQEQRGVVVWPHVLLVSRVDGVAEIYDLERDPKERHDLAGTDPDVEAHLRDALASVPAIDLDRTKKARRRRERIAAMRPTPP